MGANKGEKGQREAPTLGLSTKGDEGKEGPRNDPTPATSESHSKPDQKGHSEAYNKNLISLSDSQVDMTYGPGSNDSKTTRHNEFNVSGDNNRFTFDNSNDNSNSRTTEGGTFSRTTISHQQYVDIINRSDTSDHANAQADEYERVEKWISERDGSQEP